MVIAGPTVLEVFNTLLKHLRMSVDFELGESSRRNSSTSVSSGRGKESEERIVQNAIIQTIGTTGFLLPVLLQDRFKCILKQYSHAHIYIKSVIARFNQKQTFTVFVVLQKCFSAQTFGVVVNMSEKAECVLTLLQLLKSLCLSADSSALVSSCQAFSVETCQTTSELKS